MRASDDSAGQNVAALVIGDALQRRHAVSARRRLRRRLGPDLTAFPPGGQLVRVGEDAAALSVRQPVHGQAFFAFPPLDGANPPSEERGDLLPRVQPATRGCGVLRVAFRTLGHVPEG